MELGPDFLDEKKRIAKIAYYKQALKELGEDMAEQQSA
jgi:hypothetical protein